MSALTLELAGAEVLRPEGLRREGLGIAEGRIIATPEGRRVDLEGFRLLPGIVDIHGDGFERHVAPRRGALPDIASGIAATEAELAANGITTAMLAQFYSWEGGLRGPDFATRLLEAWRRTRADFATDLRMQLRFETHMLDHYEAVLALVDRFGVGYVVFNDHLPHEALARGKRPPRLTGQALKSGRNPEAHHAMLREMHAARDQVPDAVAGLAGALAGRGVRLGSHDDADADARRFWRGLGVTLAEFPESEAAARDARAAGDGIVLGAPNVMRGNSHKGNVSARALVMAGCCDALASDYLYPGPRLAALALAQEIGLPAAWALVSSGPARLLGLGDRGSLLPGQRADLLVIEAESGRLGATIAAGRVTYMAGEAAARFVSAGA